MNSGFGLDIVAMVSPDRRTDTRAPLRVVRLTVLPKSAFARFVAQGPFFLTARLHADTPQEAVRAALRRLGEAYVSEMAAGVAAESSS